MEVRFSIATKMLVRMILAYQQLWSAKRSEVCRHQPSCSQYALDAITAFGLWRGVGLAVKRILRCRPPYGGWDPVRGPEHG